MEQYKTTSGISKTTDGWQPSDCLRVKETNERLDLFKHIDESCQLEAVKRPTLSMLENIGNTCAIDSVLVALFSHYHELQDCEHKHPVRKKIVEWISAIDNYRSIAELVPLFKSFPSEDKFHVIGQPKDAIEFLLYFLKIFSDEITSSKVFKTVNRGVVTFASIDRKSSPVQYIPANVLLGREQVSTRDFLINRNVVENEENKVTTEEIIQSDLVVFAFGRTMPDGRFVTTQVVPSPSLTTSNGDRFFLGSMVVVESSHYVAYIRDRETWLLFDDFSKSYRKVGSEMNKWSPSPLTNGVLYFYFPDYSSVEEHMMSFWSDPNRLNVGVFEDVITDKLLNLHSMFDTVHVDSPVALKKLEKVGDGELKLCIYEAKKFLAA